MAKIGISKILTLMMMTLALITGGQAFADDAPLKDIFSSNGTPVFKMNHEKSICGQDDDREPSYEERVGRVLKSGARAGCTVTLIGRTCAISAGHCKSTFQEVHFNTPLSSGGRIQLPDEEDIYRVDQDSIDSHYGGPGDDFGVVRIKANDITGKLPGDVQGHYEVSFEAPSADDTVRITGYGQDKPDDDRNFAQQVNMGPVARVNTDRGIIYHRVDTEGGNSGSSIIHEDSQKIIGIHTHGGCYSSGGSNMGTLLATHERAKEAIKSCLQWEEENL